MKHFGSIEVTCFVSSSVCVLFSFTMKVVLFQRKNCRIWLLQGVLRTYEVPGLALGIKNVSLTLDSPLRAGALLQFKPNDIRVDIYVLQS